jgi:hypothetical protein
LRRRQRHGARHARGPVRPAAPRAAPAAPAPPRRVRPRSTARGAHPRPARAVARVGRLYRVQHRQHVLAGQRVQHLQIQHRPQHGPPRPRGPHGAGGKHVRAVMLCVTWQGTALLQARARSLSRPRSRPAAMDGKRVLVTGGSGYIGSHTVLALLDAGASVVIVDNLCNSSAAAVERVRELAGDKAGRIVFEQARGAAAGRARGARGRRGAAHGAVPGFAARVRWAAPRRAAAALTAHGARRGARRWTWWTRRRWRKCSRRTRALRRRGCLRAPRCSSSRNGAADARRAAAPPRPQLRRRDPLRGPQSGARARARAAARTAVPRRPHARGLLRRPLTGPCCALPCARRWASRWRCRSSTTTTTWWPH